MHGGIILGLDGRRFGDETTGYSEYAAVIAAQPGATGWIVLDQRIHDACLPFTDFRQTVESGALVLGARRRGSRAGDGSSRRRRARELADRRPGRAARARTGSAGRPSRPRCGRRSRPCASSRRCSTPRVGSWSTSTRGSHARTARRSRRPLRLGRGSRRHLRPRRSRLPRGQRPAPRAGPGLPGGGPRRRHLHDRTSRPSGTPSRRENPMNRLQTLVKNVTVVRPDVAAAGRRGSSISASPTAASPGSSPTSPPRTRTPVVDGGGSSPSRVSWTPTSTGASTTRSRSTRTPRAGPARRVG